jgi:hypothetical protein
MAGFDAVITVWIADIRLHLYAIFVAKSSKTLRGRQCDTAMPESHA